MHVINSLWAALAIAPVFLQPALAVLPKVWTLPDCTEEVKYDALPDRSAFWCGTLAERYADDGLHRRRFDLRIFSCRLPSAVYIIFSCLLKNFYIFMKGLHGRFGDIAFLVGLSIEGMKEELKIPDGTTAEEPIDVFAMLSGSFSMGAARITLLNPLAGAAFTAVSVLFAVISAINNHKFDYTNFGDFSDGHMGEILADMLEGVYEAINTIVAAVFENRAICNPTFLKS
ncbi:hypothetical protein BJ170DRAFT_678710 [Xylariales sp. AK1849]|nr:hypothetical protein BJ170DRAFT_678710 [Xylariales sp. AK1849]